MALTVRDIQATCAFVERGLDVQRGRAPTDGARQMRAVYYRAPDGSLPVDEYIDRLSPECQVLIDNKIALLNQLTTVDPPLAFPHSSQVKGELRELRCHCGRELYRILYRRSMNLFILLHIFRKTTGRIPPERGASLPRRSPSPRPGGQISAPGWMHTRVVRPALPGGARPSRPGLHPFIKDDKVVMST